MDLTPEGALSGIREVLTDLQYPGNVEAVTEETMVHAVCYGEGSVDFDDFLTALRNRFTARLSFDERFLFNYGSIGDIVNKLVSASHRRSLAV